MTCTVQGDARNFRTPPAVYYVYWYHYGSVLCVLVPLWISVAAVKALWIATCSLLCVLVPLWISTMCIGTIMDQCGCREDVVDSSTLLASSCQRMCRGVRCC
jgi:hypothetical protein